MTAPVRKRQLEQIEEKVSKESRSRYKILLFRDRGTCEGSVEAISRQLAKSVSLGLKIKQVDSRYLKMRDWEQKTDLLVMGAGVCSEWDALLGTEGIAKIRNFVTGGGKYLGICAGAYFAASKSLFTLDGKPPIERERALRFYKGTAAGPIVQSADPLSPQGALAVPVELLGQVGLSYYLGGPMFDLPVGLPDAKALVRYLFPISKAAVVSCRVGEKGKAVLSGLHPEFEWNLADAQGALLPEYCHLMAQLAPQETFRTQIWQEIVKELL